MFRKLFPDEYYESSYVIPYEKLYEEGYRGIIYDIDNTLVPHGFPADDRAIELFVRLRAIGFDVTLLSNNKQPRVDMFNEKINAHTISKAGKPNPGNYLWACEMMGLDKSKVMFVGDQIFTDIWGAKCAGLHAIMVKFIDPHEEIQIVLKRLIEKPVLCAYFRSRSNKKNS